VEKSLQGQTVLVTGASGGIDVAIVECLAAEGVQPIIHYGWGNREPKDCAR
jgi:NAD(P)-dependent dehydrogenase (short-subunit alcohol dehydrogenase family)